MEKKLYRDEHNQMIGGVCAGLANYFGIDVTIVRVVAAILLVSKGIGFIPYIILLIVLPKRGLTYNPNFKPGVDYTVPPQTPFGQPFIYPPVAPKKPSNAGVIFGIVLIALGSLFLIDQLDVIPDWDFEKLWPAILVITGLAIIFAGKSKEPWKDENWDKTTDTAEPLKEDAPQHNTAFDFTKKTDEPTNNNPTTL